MAIEKGYIVDKVYVVWNFEERSSEIFREYIKTFLKIRMKTSEHKYRLYEKLNYLDRQVLYFDTDSIVYIDRPND